MTKNKTNKNMNKLTLMDLINKKMQRESDSKKFKEIYASRVDGILTFEIPTDDEMLDVIDEIGENGNTRKVKEVYSKMIYRQCPMLQEKELLEAYDITRGFDIVPIFFSFADIMKIGDEIVKATGFADLDENIKK